MHNAAQYKLIARAALIAAVSPFVLEPAPLSAQHDEHPPMPRSFTEPMPLYEVGLGPFPRPITPHRQRHRRTSTKASSSRTRSRPKMQRGR
jgi:hypothetical protein